MRLSAVAALSSAAFILAACGATTSGARCGGINFAAPYAVQGDTTHGQIWIDKTIEAGVRTCGHRRPPAR